MAEEKKDDKEESEKTTSKKKSPMLLIIIIVVAVLIVGGGGTVAFLMLKGNGEKSAEAIKKPVVLKPNTLGVIFKLKSFVVNLAGPAGKNYLKIEMRFELSDARLEVEMIGLLPQIEDAVVLILSAKTYDDIKTSEGKIVLKEELLLRINSLLNTGKIKNIYFTQFVVQ